MTFRKILIAVDSEAIAVRAVDIGAELANALRAEIALINVVESALGFVSRVSPVQTALRNCTRDEGRSFEVGNQVLISSHRKLGDRNHR